MFINLCQNYYTNVYLQFNLYGNSNESLIEFANQRVISTLTAKDYYYIPCIVLFTVFICVKGLYFLVYIKNILYILIENVGHRTF